MTQNPQQEQGLTESPGFVSSPKPSFFESNHANQPPLETHIRMHSDRLHSSDSQPTTSSPTTSSTTTPHISRQGSVKQLEHTHGLSPSQMRYRGNVSPARSYRPKAPVPRSCLKVSQASIDSDDEELFSGSNDDDSRRSVTFAEMANSPPQDFDKHVIEVFFDHATNLHDLKQKPSPELAMWCSVSVPGAPHQGTSTAVPDEEMIWRWRSAVFLPTHTPNTNVSVRVYNSKNRTYNDLLVHFMFSVGSLQFETELVEKTLALSNKCSFRFGVRVHRNARRSERWTDEHAIHVIRDLHRAPQSLVHQSHNNSNNHSNSNPPPLHKTSTLDAIRFARRASSPVLKRKTEGATNRPSFSPIFPKRIGVRSQADGTRRGLFSQNSPRAAAKHITSTTDSGKQTEANDPHTSPGHNTTIALALHTQSQSQSQPAGAVTRWENNSPSLHQARKATGGVLSPLSMLRRYVKKQRSGKHHNSGRTETSSEDSDSSCDVPHSPRYPQPPPPFPQRAQRSDSFWWVIVPRSPQV